VGYLRKWINRYENKKTPKKKGVVGGNIFNPVKLFFFGRDFLRDGWK
jgi:hypothetical protein